MMPVVTRFPDLGVRETRIVVLEQAVGQLPADRHAFLEMHCTDPACDCRRVLLQVRTERDMDKVLATINYGWESLEFYTVWTHGDAGAPEPDTRASGPVQRFIGR